MRVRANEVMPTGNTGPKQLFKFKLKGNSVS